MPVVAGRVARLHRAQVLDCLEGLIGASPEPLQLIVRDIQGLDGPIDAVACDASGTPVVVWIATPERQADPITSLLAQRAWLGPRIADWLQLNPQLPFRADRRPRLLLLACDGSPATLAAAGEVGVELGRLRALETAEGTVVGLEPVSEPAERAPLEPTPAETRAWQPEPPRAAAPAPGPARGSGFRTGLHADDLGAAGRPRSAPRGR